MTSYLFSGKEKGEKFLPDKVIEIDYQDELFEQKDIEDDKLLPVEN